MKSLLSLLLSLCLFVSLTAQERPKREGRPLAARAPALFTQQGGAQGLWFDGQTVGVVGWPGVPVPAGSQVALMGRGFAGKSALVFLLMDGPSPFASAVLPCRCEANLPPLAGDAAGFEHLLLYGLPGGMHPAYGDLASDQIRALYDYTQSLRARRNGAAQARSE